MPIKGLSEIKQIPKLGNIRLGDKQINASGKEYPVELDHFRLDPLTAVPEERERLVDMFDQEFGSNGEKPKSIEIMFASNDVDTIFPQWYMRFGSGSGCKCRGDGEFALVRQVEFTKDLEVVAHIGQDDAPPELPEYFSQLWERCPGQYIVKCAGKECPYFAKKACSVTATLRVLLPYMPGLGEWWITTGSSVSIRNINSMLAHLGNFMMMPLTLKRAPMQMLNPDTGKLQTHYPLFLTSPLSLAELMSRADVDMSDAFQALPEPDPEHIESIMQTTPEDVIHVVGEPEIVEVTPIEEPTKEEKNGNGTDGGKDPLRVFGEALVDKIETELPELLQFGHDANIWKTTAQAMLMFKQATEDDTVLKTLSDMYWEWVDGQIAKTGDNG